MAGALDDSIDRLWERFGDRSSLISQLPSDAVLARARGGEFRACLARLCELVTSNQLGDEPLATPFAMLSDHGWLGWSAPEQRAIAMFADVWWTSTRTAESPDPGIGEVLLCLAHLDLPAVRWLHPWIEDLDGPAARHLAALVLTQLDDPGWNARPDTREQILAWTRSEPVILGLTVVGGAHLEDGTLGAALDLML